MMQRALLAARGRTRGWVFRGDSAAVQTGFCPRRSEAAASSASKSANSFRAAALRGWQLARHCDLRRCGGEGRMVDIFGVAGVDVDATGWSVVAGGRADGH